MSPQYAPAKSCLIWPGNISLILCKKRLYVQQTNELMKLPLSGESALCERTMLNMPPVPCRAIDRKAYKRQQEAGLKRIEPAWQSKTDYMQLEVWRYDPVCFSHAGTVDIVSLAASPSLSSR